MILNLNGRIITVDSKYLLYASAMVVNAEFVTPACDGIQEAEFFVCGFDTVKEARRHGRKLQNYPGFESVWIIRRSDMEVVQPHEKF